MLTTNLLVALAIAVGLVGIVVPVLPGVLMVLGALLAWAVVVGTPTGWVVFGVAATFLAVGALAKFLLPGRRLKASGVPTLTLVAGGVVGIVGFFVVPVVGLFLGFPLGVYLAEVQRLGSDRAWASTKQAVKAVLLSIAIELASALAAVLTWVVGLFLV